MAWTLSEFIQTPDECRFKLVSSTVDAETYTFRLSKGYTFGTAYATRSGASAFSITLAYSTTDVPNYLTLSTLTEGTPNATYAGNSSAMAQITTARLLRLTGTTLNSQNITLWVNLKRALL